MIDNNTRLSAWALTAGSIIATIGYLAASTMMHGGEHDRFTHSLWTPMSSIALAGDLLMVLGLPAVLVAQQQHARRLTLIGYVGLYATLVMLNIGEGVIETFVKPYLLHHGGIPDNPPGGFPIFEDVALVFLVVGLICLGVAVIRARQLPRWIGGLFIAAPILGMIGLPGPLELLGDYCAYVALIAIGVLVLRRPPEIEKSSTRRPPAQVVHH